jgi:hypothetical protein
MYASSASSSTDSKPGSCSDFDAPCSDFSDFDKPVSTPQQLQETRRIFNSASSELSRNSVSICRESVFFHQWMQDSVDSEIRRISNIYSQHPDRKNIIKAAAWPKSWPKTRGNRESQSKKYKAVLKVAKKAKVIYKRKKAGSSSTSSSILGQFGQPDSDLSEHLEYLDYDATRIKDQSEKRNTVSRIVHGKSSEAEEHTDSLRDTEFSAKFGSAVGNVYID